MSDNSYEAHPTDSFQGRRYLSKKGGMTVFARPATEREISEWGLKAGSYRVYHDRDFHEWMGEKEFSKKFTLADRTPEELELIKLYDFLVANGVPVISTLVARTDYSAVGVSFGLTNLYSSASDSSWGVYMSFCAMYPEDRNLFNMVAGLLAPFRISLQLMRGSGPDYCEFPLSYVQRLTGATV